MRILVAVDNSEVSPDVLRAVVTQFRPENTEIRLIHVLQPITPAVPQMAEGYAPELEAEKQQAHELIGRCADELRKSGFSVVANLEVGDVRERIIDSAAEWPADLIVIGSHGQSKLMRFLLGSVAESVARHAKCSVQIVRKPVGP